MAITYPLTLPASPTFRQLTLTPQTVVGMGTSPFTGSQQVSMWPGQWWQLSGELPPIAVGSEADAWTTFKLKLNGKWGTFYAGDVSRRNSRGNPSGTWLVGAGNVANASTLTLKSGAGAFVVGDYLQISTGTSAKLHRIVQVNSQYSYDVWPFLRTAYADGTAVTYVSPVGVFRLANNSLDWTVNTAKHHSVMIDAMEVL